MTEWIRWGLTAASVVANYVMLLQIKLAIANVEKRAEERRTADLLAAQRWTEEHFVARVRAGN